jgi:hypothetical protein
MSGEQSHDLVAYPQFVSGDGSSAEASVSREQLTAMMVSAVALVKWCAKRIRSCERAAGKADDEANPGRIVF